MVSVFLMCLEIGPVMFGNIGLLCCRVSLSLGLLAVFSRVNSGYDSLAGISQKWCMSHYILFVINEYFAIN